MIFNLPYPVSNNNYYRRGIGCTYLSSKGRSFKAFVKAYYSSIKPREGDFQLSIIVNPKLAKNGEPYKRIIDLDNALKCVLDSLQGIAYHDDKQVKDIHVKYGEPIIHGGVTVSAEQM